VRANVPHPSAPFTHWPVAGRLAAAGHHGGVQDGEPFVWYADSDDPYYTWRHSGGPIVAAFMIPAIVIICVGCTHGVSGAKLLLPGALVPFAVVTAVWEFVADRRKIVEIRLAGGELTLIRVNRRIVRYPVIQVRRIEVVRNVRGGDPSSTRIWLHVGERVKRTRLGPPDLPGRWAEAIVAAEIDLQVSDRHYDD
jgi:hypothetical protein